MRWPVLILTIPAALLGFAGLSEAFRDTLAGAAGRPTCPSFGLATVLSLVLVALGVFGAWSIWRRDESADPARVLGAARPVFENAFYLDAVQDALVVKPVYALASLVSRGDAAIVDGAVEGTGAQTMRIGGWFATWHRGALPRAGYGRPRRSRPDRDRRRDRRGCALDAAGYCVLLAPGAGCVAGAADPRRAGRSDRRHGRRRDRAGRERRPLVRSRDAGRSRRDPARGTRSTSAGYPPSICGSTSEWTASRTPWWC